MNKPKITGASRILNTAASLLLFLIFAVCILIIIGTASGTYNRINDGYNEIYGSAASTRYLSNKIRAADSCTIIEDGSGIALTSGGLLSVIYTRDGGLYEKSAAAGSEIVADGGDMIFGLDSLLIEETDSLYRIEVTVDGSSSHILVRKG